MSTVEPPLRDEALERGHEIAGFRIREPLGDQSGIGRVYLADEASTKREIALKVFDPDASENPQIRESFAKLSRAQAGFRHPHVVRILDAGTDGRHLYIAMSLVRGPTLKDVVQRGRIEEQRALGILTTVATTLDAACDSGLVYNQLQTRSILLRQDGERDHPMLGDFGVGRPFDVPELLSSGQLGNAAFYVSPEEVHGGLPTARSLVYRMAVILFECLTGAPPYMDRAEPWISPDGTLGAGEHVLAYAHLNGEVPRIRELRPDLPPAFDELLAAGLAKAPGARPVSATELLEGAVRTLPRRRRVLRRRPDDHERPVKPAAPAEPKPRREKAEKARKPKAPKQPKAPKAAKQPKQPKPKKEKAPRRVPVAQVVMIPLAVAAAAAIGAVVAPGPKHVTDELQPHTLTSGSVSLTAPANWSKASSAPAVPGLSLSDEVAVVQGRRGNAGVVAGRVPSPDSSLLPASFTRRLPDTLKRDDTVRLGRYEAYRYTGLTPKGTSLNVIAYAFPTTSGSVAVACYSQGSPPAGFLSRCDRVASTLRVNGIQALSLGPSANYASAIAGSLRSLSTDRTRLANRLRGAHTQGGESTTAYQLAAAYTTAAKAIKKVSPPPDATAVQASLVSALQQVAAAYGHMGAAAAARDRGQWNYWRGQIQRGEKAVAQALAGLKPLGYKLS